ncbi:MAG: outer membrane protein assembly factor BamA [Candidatus Babeliales bacterium]
MLKTQKRFAPHFLLLVAIVPFFLAHGLALDEQPTNPERLEEVVEAHEQSELPQASINDEPATQNLSLPTEQMHRINDIIVRGNRYIEAEAILNKVPFRSGDQFNPMLTGDIIKSLYNLGYFEQINIMGEPLPDNRMNLYIIVQEGKRIAGFEFVGNDHMGEKTIRLQGKSGKPNEPTIRGKINLDTIKVLHPQQIKKVVSELKKMYQEKDYHLVEITPEYKEIDDAVIVIFNIKEGIRSYIKRVYFKGNKAIPSKKLRSVIFTREDWVLGFLDKSGSYQPDAIEMDKHGLQYFYQNHGYLTARVTDVDVVMDPDTKQYAVTFTIDEGDFYTVSDVHAPGNDLLAEEYILPFLPLKPGSPYSREKMNKSIEVLRNTWGEFGHIFADIIPQVIPDEEKKTVAITFISELGQKIYANRISITGNNKTREAVIRRQILVDEGELITHRKMERSKDRIEGLGYFDRKKGINWKTTRVDDATADLELLIEEIKTGKVGFQLGTGGDPKSIMSPAKGFAFSVFLSDANAFGQGWQYNFGAEIAQTAQSFNINLSNPWMWDKPILGALDLYVNRSNYGEEIKNAANDVTERVVGASLSLGFLSNLGNWLEETSFLTQIGVQNFDYAQPPIASPNLPEEQRIEFQKFLNSQFLFGTLGWFSAKVGQDVRNHPAHATRGYQWSLNGKVGGSGKNNRFEKQGISFDISQFGFYKVDFDTVWYTPIIGEDTLILGVHAHAGTSRAFDCCNIPYRELYHIGGPGTVRGYTYGQIGPFWRDTSLGARNAFWVNAELIFPVTPDYSTKVAVFYDGGAGWSIPPTSSLTPPLLINNNFNYRHAIGFSIRLQRPMPISIDWGFKLDKRRGEKTSEIHFGAFREF